VQCCIQRTQETCLHKVVKTDDLVIYLNSMPCTLCSVKCAATQSCHSDSATGALHYTQDQEQNSDGDFTCKSNYGAHKLVLSSALHVSTLLGIG